MAIEFKCPQCGKVQSVPDYSRGKVFKCQCGHALIVPEEGKISGWTFLMLGVIGLTVPMFYYLLFVYPRERREAPSSPAAATDARGVDEPGPEPAAEPNPGGGDTETPRSFDRVERLPQPYPVQAKEGRLPSRDEAAVLNIIRLGDDAFAEGAYEDALAHYRRASSMDAKSQRAKERVASALFNLQRYDEALDAGTTLLADNPEDGYASYLLGSMYRRLGRAQEALTCLRAAVELDPRNVAARHELARVLQEMGRPQEAITQFYDAVSLCRKLLAEGRNDARLHAELGTFLGRVGNETEANKHLKQAGRMAREDIALQYILAKAYLELGRKREAQQYAAAAKALGHRDAEKLLKQMRLMSPTPPARPR